MSLGTYDESHLWGCTCPACGSGALYLEGWVASVLYGSGKTDVTHDDDGDTWMSGEEGICGCTDCDWTGSMSGEHGDPPKRQDAEEAA